MPDIDAWKARGSSHDQGAMLQFWSAALVRLENYVANESLTSLLPPSSLTTRKNDSAGGRPAKSIVLRHRIERWRLSCEN